MVDLISDSRGNRITMSLDYKCSSIISWIVFVIVIRE
jgi:hypothetical protein